MVFDYEAREKFQDFNNLQQNSTINQPQDVNYLNSEMLFP